MSGRPPRPGASDGGPPRPPRPTASGGGPPEPRSPAGPLTAGRLLAGLAIAAALAAVLHGHAATPAPAPRPPHPVVVAADPAARPAPPVSPSRPAPTRPSPPGPAAISRSFVVAYAAFVYGRLPAGDLPGLGPELRRRLAALHPDPAPAVLGAADPRLRSLRLAAGRSGRARAVAVIEDGAAVYDIVIELRRRPAGWTITGLGETG